MTIKHIGKRCGLCNQAFNLFSSPFTCSSCGQLAHPRCGKREFVAEQAAPDMLRKSSICISCWKDGRTQLINRRLTVN